MTNDELNYWVQYFWECESPEEIEQFFIDLLGFPVNNTAKAVYIVEEELPDLDLDNMLLTWDCPPEELL